LSQASAGPVVETVRGPVAGVTDERITTMLVDNPRRYLENVGTC
jgi:predicted metal-dependent phosphotriesterase family hydrolase